MSKHSIVRWIKIIGVYLLVAAVAALGWLWCALPEEVYLEPEQTLTLPRFGWVEPLRGHGSRNVASTRAAGSYQTTLALGGWLPVKTIRATVMQRPTVTVCGTPFGVKMFSEGALVVGFSEVHTAAGTVNPAKQAGLRLGDRVIRMGNTVTETNEQVHEHTSLLVVNPVVHTGYATSACFTHFFYNGFQSLIHFHECFSLDTYKLHKFHFLSDTKI